jgi:hypothetical protein
MHEIKDVDAIAECATVPDDHFSRSRAAQITALTEVGRFMAEHDVPMLGSMDFGSVFAGGLIECEAQPWAPDHLTLVAVAQWAAAGRAPLHAERHGGVKAKVTTRVRVGEMTVLEVWALVEMPYMEGAVAGIGAVVDALDTRTEQIDQVLDQLA